MVWSWNKFVLQGERTKRTSFYVGLSFILTFSAAMLHQINKKQPEPYLDEVFHIPQTQRFCNGTFDEVNKYFKYFLFGQSE